MQGRAKTCGKNKGGQVAEMFEVRLREGSLTVRLGIRESQGKSLGSLLVATQRLSIGSREEVKEAS